MGKVNCQACNKSCKGQAIRLQEKYFHIKCFKCRECQKPLATGGFYTKDEFHYCVEDYQRLFGVKCHSCGKFVEGEVVTALGNTYHEQCFLCTKCSKKFDPGDKVTFVGQDYLCNDCLDFPHSPASTPGDISMLPDNDVDLQPIVVPPTKYSASAPCTPAKQDISKMDGHVSGPDLDFSDDAKGTMNGTNELLRSDELLRSVPTSNTSGYKSDLSVDRGNRTTSRYSNYSDVFESSDGNYNMNQSCDSMDCSIFLEPYYRGNGRDPRHRLSPIQNIMRYRSTSPGSTVSHTSRKSKESTGSFGSRFDKFYKTSYLDMKDNFKKGPSINPNLKEKSPKHYHRPENFSYSKVRRDFVKPAKKAGLMSALGEREYGVSLKKMEPYKPIKTQEPIQLSKIPDAQKDSNYVAPIERDDWPAPPDPAAAYPDLLRDHRLRRKSVDMVDSMSVDQNEEPVDKKIEKEIEELSKMTDSGAAKVILGDLKKMKTDGPILDPRSASRTPNASVEPPYRTRYDSPNFASPSRDLDQKLRLRSLDCLTERKYRTSSQNSNFPVPKPGYSLAVRSSALDNRNRYSYDGLDTPPPRRPGSSAAVLQRTSYYSSQTSMDDYDPTTGLRNTRIRSSTVSEGFMSPYFGYRRSVPSLFKVEEPIKIYPYEHLKSCNGILPPDVDKNKIEMHLTREEFESVFGMTQEDFYRLAEWKRNDMKIRVGLF